VTVVEIGSTRKPGPFGFVSPLINLTISAVYSPSSSELSLNSIASVGATEKRSP
jgi:hypothetical protein